MSDEQEKSEEIEKPTRENGGLDDSEHTKKWVEQEVDASQKRMQNLIPGSMLEQIQKRRDSKGSGGRG